MKIHGVEVIGVDVDPETRCAHYRGLTTSSQSGSRAVENVSLLSMSRRTNRSRYVSLAARNSIRRRFYVARAAIS